MASPARWHRSSGAGGRLYAADAASRAWRRATSSLALLAAGIALIGVQREAAACSVLLPEAPESVRCDEAAGVHTSAQSLELAVASIEVRRSAYPPPGLGDCGELGAATLQFRVAGSDAWPGDIGVLVSHTAGAFPWFRPPIASTSAGAGWLLGTADGVVSFLGPDDPRQPLDIDLVARAIDCAGGASPPLEVTITDPGRPDAATSTAASGGDAGLARESSSERPGAATGSACNVAPPTSSAAGAWLASLAVIAVARRAGRHRPPRRPA